jgi:outer membrane protein assembly factor BamB
MILRLAARLSLAVATLVTSMLIFGDIAQAADPLDWPYWRGPEMNGISREKNIVGTWDPSGDEGSNLLWKRTDLGTRSTPIYLNNRIYLLTRHNPGTPQEQEKVVCVEADSGETLWENIFNVFLSDVPDTRVAWSSVCGDPETGNIFALGVCGLFQCIDGETGKTIWQHSLSEEYGILTTYGGRTNYPIIHEQLVIISGVNTGWGENSRPAHRFLAFDKRNGQAVWYEGTRPFPEDTTYSAPVLANFNGQLALVVGAGDGDVYAFQPRTGKIIWNYRASARGINTTPVVFDNLVICGHSEENVDSTQMGALFALDGNKSGSLKPGEEVWRNKEMFIGKVAPIYVDGRIYAIDDSAKLLVVDAKTGKQITKKSLGTMQRSSPIYADGKIFTCEANGRWYAMKPTEDGVEFTHKLRLDGEESNGSPIISHGKLIIPTSGALYCVGRPEVQPSADPIPALADEQPISEDRVPAQVQIVPVESLLRPGMKQQLQVRLFNKNGQFIDVAKPEDVKLELDGPGQMTKGGEKQDLHYYVTPGEEAGHTTAVINVDVKGLKSMARVRVVPELNWKFDFNDMQVPGTWIGARVRHIPLDFDLYEKLKDQDPKAGGLYIYLHTNFYNTAKPTAAFDDSTPRETWTEMLRYFDLDREGKPNTVEEAKVIFDPLLEKLKAENVVADWTWEEWSKEVGGTKLTGPKLTVNQGKRAEHGNGVLCKISTVPKGTRSQAWMGQPGISNYTIQADVYGVSDGVRRPDIGLIAQRYTLDMMGEALKIQIRTWPSSDYRIHKDLPFTWEGNTWYTMKFKASAGEGSKSKLQGKIWKRGEEEPADWMVEMEDDIPNTIGSPGLFGNAQKAELFYDNLTVTANE